MKKYTTTSIVLIIAVWFLIGVVDKIVAQTPWDGLDMILTTIAAICTGAFFYCFTNKL